MSDTTLQDIKDRINIVEFLGSYITVKKAGGNFKAVCPFHNEKSASLMISPQKQIWHCFGCGEGGDIFGFLMRYENIEFKEALKILATKAGVALPQYRAENKAESDEKEILLKINAFAAEFFHQIMLKEPVAKPAREYLQKRGLKPETIKKWKVGFAPDEFHALEFALAKKKVGKEHLVKAGVSAKNERGQIYDRFRGRITFPIFNYYGEPVGFSARILAGDAKQAKYINSPETAIYHKGKVLFGLNYAKEAIRKQDEAIIVEGQMDCIAAHQAGFTNTVASSGTALTDLQLSALGRLTRNLKFCFDTDQAGVIATRRAVEQYLGKDFTIRIIVFSGAKDPDELIQKNPESWQTAVQNAPLFLDYYLEKSFEQFNPTSVQEKKKIAQELLPLLSRLTDPVEMEHYVNMLASKLETSVSALQAALNRLRKPDLSRTAPQTQHVTLITKPTSPTEKELLGALLLFEDFRQRVLEEAVIEDFESLEIRALLGPWFKRTGPLPPPETPLAKEGIFMVESQQAESPTPEAYRRQLDRSFALLRLNAIKRQQKSITLEIKRAEGAKQPAKVAELTKLFSQLAQLRVAYEKQL